MDFSELQEKYGPLLKQYYLPLFLGLIGFGLLLYGLISSVIPKSTKGEISFEAASTSNLAEVKASEKTKQITVDVEGAVIKPGVYALKADSRIQDALISAGGMSEQADRGKIARNLNLASKLIDGGKIYIPFVGESVEVAQTQTSGQTVMGDSTGALINLNTATSSELDSLSGVGPATSEKIINNRPYEKIEDLLSKKVVGQSVFEKIKAKIATY